MLRIKLPKKALGKSLVSFLILIFALSIFLLTPWGRVFVKTSLLLSEILPGSPIHPLNLVTKEPIKEEVEITSGAGKVKTDIYRPNDLKRHPTAIFVVAGINPEDKSVVVYTKSLARLGLIIAVPKIDDLVKGDLKYQSVENLVDTFGFLKAKDFVNSQRIGFFGICAGGTFSLLAGENSKISKDVDFVVTVSPYYDFYSGLFSIFTHRINEDGKSYSWNTHQQVTSSVQKLLINSLENEKEKRIVNKLLEGDVSQEEIQSLSSDGRAIFDFLSNSNPQKFDQLWNKLPKNLKENIFPALSPKVQINNLSAKVFILSDGKDTYIPHTESWALAKDLSSDRKDFVELDILEHAQLTKRLPRITTVKQIIELYGFVYRIFLRIS